MKTTTVLTLAALLGVPSLSHAGFTATSNPFGITNVDNGAPGATIGDTFSTSAPGTFLSYLPDSAADPQIAAGDLANFRFTLFGTVTSVDQAADSATYAGTYRIYYAPGNIDISTGTLALTAAFTAANTATLTGSLTQTGGPGNPAFTDLGARYNNNPVGVTGVYAADPTNPLSATATVVLRQSANPVPEPAPLAALGLGGLAVLRRRRKA